MMGSRDEQLCVLDLMIRFIGTCLQLQFIITAHVELLLNELLSESRTGLSTLSNYRSGSLLPLQLLGSPH
jgi:hypothetical protein